MQIDHVSELYLKVGLRIGQMVEGFVDSYHGPEALRAEAEAIDDPAAALDELQTAIGELDDPARRTYLGAQALALQAVLRRLSGDDIPYRDEVEAGFDIRPEWTPEERFEAAHAELDRLLPGDGPLNERREAYRTQFHLATDAILPLAERLKVALRERTKRIITLPEGEDAYIELVSDQPWGGYNWYLGGMQSRIEINTDLPVLASRLPDLIAHEIYSGHHTEHALKEQHWLRERGFGEAAIALLSTPQAVISEGIATTAFESLVPADEQVEWLREHVYEPAAMDVDIEADLAIQRASKTLGYVDANAALMLHDQGESADDIVEYMRRYGLLTEEEARSKLPFISSPTFRGYIFTYTSGYELVSQYLDAAGDRDAALRSILTEHWTPSILRSSAEQS